jgi:hypothetical protein
MVSIPFLVETFDRLIGAGFETLMRLIEGAQSVRGAVP